MSSEEHPPRLLVIGAHPDDAEFHAGGIIREYALRGWPVKLVSVTDGGAGHHRLNRDELVGIRRAEAAAAGAVLGVPYVTWDFPDGYLQNTPVVRDAIIREVRRFRPDLVLTHRTCDYHPDHRAVGEAVQDASYLITVPLVAADVPHLRRDPIVAYMVDLFTRPSPLVPHVLRNIEAHLGTIVDMLACHRSQVFEWLPYNQQVEDRVPADASAQRAWLHSWFCRIIAARADRFRAALVEAYGDAGAAMKYIEAFEISEYAAPLSPADRQRLFP